ncbi:MAG: hypothetical protein RLN78_05220 [Phycisphaerales bacterium]
MTKDIAFENSIKLIDYELSYNSTTKNLPGWTPWAIGLSLSAVIWKTTDQFLAQPPQSIFWHHLLMLLFLRTLFINLRDLIDISSMTNRSPAITHEYRSKRHFPSKILLSSSLELLPIIAVMNSPLTYGNLFIYTVAISYAIIFLIKFSPMIEFVRIKEHYISEHSVGNELRAAFAIAELVLISTISLLAYHGAQSYTSTLGDPIADQSSVKSSLLAFALVILLSMIQTRSHESKFESELHRIRQKLLLGAASKEDYSNLKLLTSGIDAGEYIDELNKIFNDSQEQILKSIREINNKIHQLETWDINSIKMKKLKFLEHVQKTNSSNMSLLTEADKLHGEYTRSVDKIKDLIIGGLDKKISIQFLESTTDSFQSLIDAIADCQTRLHTLSEKISE